MNRLSSNFIFMRKLFVSLGIVAILLPILASAQENQPPVNGYCPRLYSDLQRGDRDSNTDGQVTELQKFLTDYYDLNYEDYVTGYFGRLTQQNVIRFQTEQGLPAFGYVGPLTRAAIARVCGGSGGTTFSASPTSGAVPLRVVFRAGVEWSSAYFVDFGDGQSSPLRNNCPDDRGACGQPTAEHVYSNPGTYMAKLVYQPPFVCNGPAGTSCAQVMPAVQVVGTVMITVTGTGSTLSATPMSGTAPLAVTFTASTAGNMIDFGDGTSGTMPPLPPCYGYECPNPPTSWTQTHTYVQAGTYTAQLIKSDPGGCGTVIDPSCLGAPASRVVLGTVMITVTGTSSQNPTMTVSPTSGVAPLSVQFVLEKLNMQGQGATKYVVVFGDGTASYVTSAVGKDTVSHTYASAGTYIARLEPHVPCVHESTTVQCMLYVQPFGTVTITVSASGQFSVSPTSGIAPLTVAATFQLGSACSPYTLTWGDGTNSSHAPQEGLSCAQVVPPPTTIKHTYAKPGTYIVMFQQGTAGATATITVTGTTASQDARIVFFSVKGDSKVSPDAPATLQFGTEHAARCDLLAVNNANASYMDQYNAGAYQTVASNIGIGGEFGTAASLYTVYPSALARADVLYVLTCMGSNGSTALGAVHVYVSGQSENGTISGRITMGPTCAAVPPNGSAECADRPLQTNLNVYKNGTFVKTLQSDVNGYYTTIVMAGTYELRAHEKSSSFYPRCNPVSATVAVGAHPIVNISCDTGIR